MHDGSRNSSLESNRFQLRLFFKFGNKEKWLVAKSVKYGLRGSILSFLWWKNTSFLAKCGLFSPNLRWISSISWSYILWCVMVNSSFVHGYEPALKLVWIEVEQPQTFRKVDTRKNVWSIISRLGSHLAENFTKSNRWFKSETN